MAPRELLAAEGANGREPLNEEVLRLQSWDLSPRQLCDAELLLNGGFHPLRGFMTRADYESVCRDMRLSSGALWPLPIVLDVTEEFAAGLSEGDRVALRHPEGMVLGILNVEDIWQPDREQEAAEIFGTADDHHPGVFSLLHQTNPVYIGGPVDGIQHVPHHTFKDLRYTPRQLREEFAQRGWERVVAFQTRNPMHRAHVELTRRAAEQAGANLLLHPVVGLTKPGDVSYYTRVRCYQAVLPQYPQGSAMLSLLPLAMRMAGPREAVWHAIIRKNYGCTHFIVGRDHAGPGADRNGQPFYGPYDAQELLARHSAEIGIEPVPFEELVYDSGRDRYVPRSEASKSDNVLSLSGTELRRLLNTGEDVPEWFSYPEVMRELRRSYPARHRQGFTVFFTGLPSSGKSTIANVLLSKLMEDGSRPVTLLDGDLVRKHLSSELTFSKEHRDLNIKRIGYVASEITKNGGVAICAPIAPYAATRREVREMIGQHGGMIEAHVATPVEVCEERDVKGLYAKARAGVLTGFTGVDDPYEAPESPEVRIDTTDSTPEECAEQVIAYLRGEGYLSE
ncbi:MAG: bifunctional sulfate adenylyltransferase/adenylylsulfate kinase [Chloroflexota bacterium]